MNGDGFDDVIIGALRRRPERQLIPARAMWCSARRGVRRQLDLSDLDGTNGFQISGEAADDHSGCLGLLGGGRQWRRLRRPDHRGRCADPNGDHSGASYVVFGQAGGFAANLDLSDLDGTNGFQISGEAADDFSGRSVSSAGDVNGDGFDDLIIGAHVPTRTALFWRELCGVWPGDGPVTRLGTDADDFLVGGDFDDTLHGDGGDDFLEGREGDDLLDGGAGADRMEGGAGDDTYFVDDAGRHRLRRRRGRQLRRSGKLRQLLGRATSASRR